MTSVMIVCYAIASVHLAIATLANASRVTLAHVAAAIGLALSWPVVAVWSTGATLLALGRRAARRTRSRGLR